MKNIFLLLALFCSKFNFAQYDIASLTEIPEALKKNANAVKRFEEIVFEVIDIDRAKYNVHRVFTVLNEEGIGALTFHEFSDKSSSIDDMEIKMFDAGGKLISKVKKKDIYKQADLSGFVSDGYHYYHTMKPVSYPVTIEYNCRESYFGTLNYPGYTLLKSGESVQSSSFIVKIPDNLDLRYKENEVKLKPEISSEGKYKKYTWSVTNMPAIKYEAGSVRSDYYYPKIILAPNKFSIYNTSGEMTSWSSLGQWLQYLCTGLDELPVERKVFFANLVKDAPDERAKIALVYKYLQENFRYVSIQLGIGGWKPFPAKFTDEKKYGDCKALSFYMYSVLKSLGIKSYVACINAGANLPPVDPAFPINAFNHLILCVPQKQDSIWLECTSQTTDFNYLSNFTENRNALLVTEKGGVLVPTPVSDPRKNRLITLTNIYLDPSAFGRTTTKFICNGEFRESMQELSIAKIDDQKEAIVYTYGFKQPDEFKFTKITDQEFSLDMIIEKIPEFSAGSKMFLRPRMNQVLSAVLPTSEGRTHDLYFKSPLYITDTTVYNLPEGYTMDVLPRNASIENDYVKYQTNFWYDESSRKVYSTYEYCIKKNKIPVTKYADVKKGFDQIVSDGTQKIVIKKS